MDTNVGNSLDFHSRGGAGAPVVTDSGHIKTRMPITMKKDDHGGKQPRIQNCVYLSCGNIHKQAFVLKSPNQSQNCNFVNSNLIGPFDRGQQSFTEKFLLASRGQKLC